MGTDQDALALTHAIALQESGQSGKPNYNAVGDNGTSHGAYQWQPGNFEAAAKEAGLDPNDRSPMNQDKVAYYQVKKYKDKGLDPGQIASIWNSGSPDNWKDHRGTTVINGKSISYDTPAYVNGVKQHYQQLKGSQLVNPNAPQQNSNQFVTPPQTPPPSPDTSTNAPPTQDKGLIGNVISGAGDFLKSAEAPFLGVAAIPVQLLAKAMGRPDPYAQGIPAGIPGTGQKSEVTPLDLEKKAGDIAQVGSYFLPGEGILGAAGMGALQGAGAAASRGGDLGTVAGEGVIGGALGGGAGLAAKGLGYGFQKTGNLLSGEGLQKSVQGIKDAYSSALNLTAAERGFEGRSGKDIAQVLMDNQVPLGRYGDGTLDASKAIEKLQETLRPLNEQADRVLAHPQGVVQNIALSDVLDAVKARISDSKIPATQEKAMISQAEQFLNDEAAKYGTEVPPNIADTIKQGFQNSVFNKAITPEGKLTNNVQYILSDELKNATEKAVAGTDTEVNLKALNSQRSDLIDALKRLTKLDGIRRVKGGQLGNMAGGLIGTIIGSHAGGIPGGLAGDYFGTKAAEFLNNPETKIGLARARAQAAGKMSGLLGQASSPVGKTLSGMGKTISKAARPAGLLANLISQQ